MWLIVPAWAYFTITYNEVMYFMDIEIIESKIKP